VVSRIGTKFRKIPKQINSLAIKLHVGYSSFIRSNASYIWGFVGLSYLYFGLNSIAHAQTTTTTVKVQFDPAEINRAICQLLRLIEGSFGGLLMTVAGVGAVISAAFGQMKAGYSMLVTGLGAFILRSLVSLYFQIPDCKAIGQTPGGGDDFVGPPKPP